MATPSYGTTDLSPIIAKIRDLHDVVFGLHTSETEKQAKTIEIQDDRDRLRLEVDRLKERIVQLEKEVEELMASQPVQGPEPPPEEPEADQPEQTM